MPMKIAQGAVHSRMLLAILQVCIAGLSDMGFDDATALDVLLIAGIYIGLADRRPMTAGKLAAYVGMPRATATRHLKEMMRGGIVEQDDQGRWKMASRPEHQRVLSQAVIANTQHILRAAASLSKMDTSNIAQR